MGRRVSERRAARPRPVVYPVRDDEPMGETDQHRDEMAYYAVDVLRHHFREQPDVYVSGNNFVYWVEGDPKQVVSPDAYVVRGVPGHTRDVFLAWQEGGRLPVFVLEVTSKKTRRHDQGPKLERYRVDLRVPECFLFDPRGDWIPERLRGHRLDATGAYVRLEPDARGRFTSEALGLELAVVDGHLRFFRPGEDTPLPTAAEQRARAEAADAQAAQARAQAEQARAQAEQARAQAEQARAQAERERAARARAEQDAAAARARAEALEAELRRLRGTDPDS